MKQLFLIIALVFVGMGVYAQPGQGNMPSPEERAKRQTERLKTELSLTADQVKKVEEIYVASGKKMDEMRRSSQGDREAMRTKMDALRTEQDTKIKAVLTPAQVTKYQEFQKKLEAERAERRGGGQGGNRN